MATTFTFRIPDSLAGRLNSAQMRTWLADFLRCPNSLPPDPGSGEERVSLTLPRELVGSAAGYLRCSPSEALRRIAAPRLGVGARNPRKVAPDSIGGWSYDSSTGHSAVNSLGPAGSIPMTDVDSALALVIAFLPVIAFLAWLQKEQILILRGIKAAFQEVNRLVFANRVGSLHERTT